MNQDLRTEEWGFLARKKEWLRGDLQNRLWIPEKDVQIALVHVVDRVCHRMRPTKGGRGLTGKEFERFIETPFLELSSSQKALLRNTERRARGIYGGTSLQLISYPSYHQMYQMLGVEDQCYTFFVNWDESDEKLAAGFKEFARDKRPAAKPNRPKSGRRTVDREKLKYIAAFRLHRHYRKTENYSLSRALSLVSRTILSEIAPENAFYSNERDLIEAARKGEKEILGVLRVADFLFEIEQKTNNQRDRFPNRVEGDGSEEPAV